MESHQERKQTPIVRAVEFACRWPGVVVFVSLVLCGLALAYTGTHFALNTDSSKLLSPNLPWRQQEAAFDTAFPQRNDLIAVVIDGATPMLADKAAADLAAKLHGDTEHFRSVTRSDGGAFFQQNSLLLLPLDEVRNTTTQLMQSQPMLGALAQDPSLRGVMNFVSLMLQGVQYGAMRLDELAQPFSAFSTTIERVAGGQPAFLPWQSLFTGRPPETREVRRFVMVQPVLDYTALTPGEAAVDAIHHMAAELSLNPAHGVDIRLTGSVPLADDEFATLAEGAVVMAAATIGSMLVMLWLAVRSLRIVGAIFATLVVGLSWTTAFGLLAIGPFNLISIAFISLFVGLGVDFAIQFSIRYRAERHRFGNLQSALCNSTGAGIGRSLTLAAASVAAGFYAFLPTDYRGVSELGLIAGTGMIIAYGLSFVLLPALLKLVGTPHEPAEVGLVTLRPLGRLLRRRRAIVLAIGGALCVACIALLPWLTFDFDPIDLQSQKVQSVATLRDLAKSPDTTPYTIDVLEPSVAAASATAKRLSALPEVAQTITIESFVPENQQEKLALISQAASMLQPALNPPNVRPPPSDPELVETAKSTAAALQNAAGNATTPGAVEARRLAAALERLANGSPEFRDRVKTAFIPSLRILLDQLRASLEAAPVSLATLPADLVRDWVTPDGRARIQVSPKGGVLTNAQLRQFSKAVQAVAPNATGMPISVQQSGATVVRAFVEAGVLSFLAVTILLAIVLRHAREVLLTLVPLVMTVLLTLGTTVAIGLPLNYANIIALPLIFGIGVAFNIYFVVAWRSGVAHMLESSTSRAIVFSALTTSTAFGSLWLSPHPGTASMGELLAIALIWTLITALFFLPALLGPPRETGSGRGPEKSL